MKFYLVLGALLATAPVFSQQASWFDPQLSGAEVKWFQLTESESEVRQRLGQPAMVSDFGQYRSWQYQTGEVEHDDFSHALVFQKADGKLVSISRNYNPERNVDALFPPGETIVARFRAEGQPEFAVRVRKLSGGRVLLAIGTSKPGQTTSQLVLMRQSELSHVYPWVEAELQHAAH